MIIYSIVGILMVFLLGYVIGKHQGWQKGYKQAEVVIPLEMRQQSLENGRCIICAEFWANTRKCEIYSRELDTL